MTDFLIKSTLSLVVLLGVYHLLLEKEKMHRFNRFYLLFALVFSMVIPFITIEVVQEIAQPAVTPGNIQMLPATTVVVDETNYFAIALWSLYGFVTVVLGFRFMCNVMQISKKMKSTTAIAYQNAQLVLVPEKTLPHTFLNTIFINESEYNNRQVEAELYTHELTHVTQKHTLDILFIEVLKTVFWFNPIFIFYKKAIQLNHEFLADEKVVHSYNNVPFYQSLLLSKANANPTFYLTSNLNYLITKKRLLMMTKTTSNSKSIAKKIILIPVLSGLFFLFCFKTIAQVKNIAQVTTKTKLIATNDSKKDEYYAGVRVVIHDLVKNKEIDTKYEDLSEEYKKRALFYVPTAREKKSPTTQELENFKDPKKYAIWIDDVHQTNKSLNNFKPSEIAFFQGSSVYKNARSKKFPQPYQYNFYTHNYFDKNLKNSHKKFSGEKLEVTICKDKNTRPIRTK
ncbi:regulatory sensor-transducer, BlaR1/MecR1 family protein [Flavobacterium sp. CHNK8]|uniref:M56 family metallopeptidase n=1 Tax=Flavobacterium sp. CHNK8 TaxID=2871165 RepID=UPI001C8DF36C|nr:M56 family metallopeptidase [Flavobacterium sp. CHNK8]QZK89312.1 regulatory sensor-transducer, BlaR1/MecR1 family protein [Flavobacterium sp. CHNK8]